MIVIFESLKGIPGGENHTHVERVDDPYIIYMIYF